MTRELKGIGPIWQELYGGLWHTTRPESFLGIVAVGAILPHPKDAQNKHGNTFVQSIDGVSLFDFASFDVDNQKIIDPTHNWRGFVPSYFVGGAVWIELKRDAISSGFINLTDLQERRDAQIKVQEDKSKNIRLMAGVEAAHIGPIPTSAFKRVLFYYKASDQYQEVEYSPFNQEKYGLLLSRLQEEKSRI